MQNLYSSIYKNNYETIFHLQVKQKISSGLVNAARHDRGRRVRARRGQSGRLSVMAKPWSDGLGARRRTGAGQGHAERPKSGGGRCGG